MSSAVAKLSVSIPYDLAATVRKRAGAGGLSSFVARAMRHELEREQLGTYLGELDVAFGPVPSKLLKEARDAWDKR
jgi:Arc/MetJ family transcription regulator